MEPTKYLINIRRLKNNRRKWFRLRFVETLEGKWRSERRLSALHLSARRPSASSRYCTDGPAKAVDFVIPRRVTQIHSITINYPFEISKRFVFPSFVSVRGYTIFFSFFFSYSYLKFFSWNFSTEVWIKN